MEVVRCRGVSRWSDVCRYHMWVPPVVEYVSRFVMVFGPLPDPLSYGVVDVACGGGGVVAEMVCCRVYCVDQEGHRCEFFFRGDVCIAEREGVQVGVMLWWDVELFAKGGACEVAFTAVYYRVLRRRTAAENTFVGCGVTTLPPSVRAPAIPECAEDRCPDSWCG